MQAVKLEHFGMMLFSEVPISDPVKAELRDDLGGEILDDVTLEERPDMRGWPQGEGKIEALLCVSHSDPRHFEVVRYRNQAEALAFDPVRLSYNVIRSEMGWKTFLSTMKRLTRIAGQTDETDTEEGWAETMKHLGRAD